MAIECPSCGRQYDVTLFEFDKTVKCDCGKVVSADMPKRRTTEEKPSPEHRDQDEQK